jgi:hypothetical protein
MTRPTIFSDALTEQICEELAEGKSLRAICSRPEMPGMTTVLRWTRDDPSFGSRYAHAREAQAETMDDKILTVADACSNETALSDRVKIDAYKWRAAKLAPKRYGDKTILGGDADNVELARLIAFQLTKASREG